MNWSKCQEMNCFYVNHLHLPEYPRAGAGLLRQSFLFQMLNVPEKRLTETCDRVFSILSGYREKQRGCSPRRALGALHVCNPPAEQESDHENGKQRGQDRVTANPSIRRGRPRHRRQREGTGSRRSPASLPGPRVDAHWSTRVTPDNVWRPRGPTELHVVHTYGGLPTGIFRNVNARGTKECRSHISASNPSKVFRSPVS